METLTEGEEAKTLTAQIAQDLYAQIAEKAAAMRVGMDTAVATLLRLGLATQAQREREVTEIAQKLRSASPDSDESAHLGERLGETIFGR